MIYAKWMGRVGVFDSEQTLDYFAQSRAVGAIEDTIFFFEHPPTFSYHYWNKDKNTIRDFEWFEQYRLIHRVGLEETNRGGGIMYHGPGQIILGPVMKLKKGFGIPEYARALEETMIRTLKDLFSISAFRIRYNRNKQCWMTEQGEYVKLFGDQERSGVQGVWVRKGKSVCKIGFLGSRFDSITGIVSRGCALNLCPDLRAFTFIDPCDLPGVEATSVEELKNGMRPSVDAKLAESMAEIFAHVLDADYFIFKDSTLL